MDLLNAMKISATGLAAHRTKMNVIAENLANVDTTRTAQGGPYRRKMVVFKGEDIDTFKSVLEKRQRDAEIARIEFSPIQLGKEEQNTKGTGVNVDEIKESQEDFRWFIILPIQMPIQSQVTLPCPMWIT